MPCPIISHIFGTGRLTNYKLDMRDDLQAESSGWLFKSSLAGGGEYCSGRTTSCTACFKIKRGGGVFLKHDQRIQNKAETNEFLSYIPCLLGLITLRTKHSGAVYCNRSCLWRADGGRAGVRAVFEPYYSQHAQCLRLSERFFSFFSLF